MPPSEPPPVAAPLPLQVAGWYGMAAILTAYAMSSFGLLDQGVPFQLLNLTGGIGVGLLCWRQRTWPAFWLEAVWAGVALVALIRSFLGAP